MSCQDCREAIAVEDDIVSSVNAVHEEACACEQHSVSDLSPGRVNDDEHLHFFIRAPDGLADSGFVNRTFVLQAWRNGLSVLREQAEDSEFTQTINELESSWIPAGKKVHGILTFEASAVRYDEEVRLCCIYDTGLQGKPHHADIMAANQPQKQLTRRELKELKENAILKLIERMGTAFTPKNEIRNGAFKD